MSVEFLYIKYPKNVSRVQPEISAYLTPTFKQKLNDLHFYSAFKSIGFDISKHFKGLLYSPIHTPMVQHWEQFWVQCLNKGHGL